MGNTEALHKDHADETLFVGNIVELHRAWPLPRHYLWVIQKNSVKTMKMRHYL